MLNRPVRLWARDDATRAITLRERVVYGDDPQAGLGAVAVAAAYLRGRVYRQFDGAGRLTFGYDFKGNPVEKVRDVVADTVIATQLAAGGTGPPRIVVDWTRRRPSGRLPGVPDVRRPQPPDLPAISARRRRWAADPHPRPRPRRRAGERGVDGEPCVERIAYDAGGRRVLVAYGNGVLTRYAYDARTARLARLRTERRSASAALTYQGDGTAVQDLAYRYDLAGNTTAIRDRTPGSGIPGTPLGAHALDRDFTYDALYRLRTATGREADDTRPAAPWRDPARGRDPTRTRAYTQEYTYDADGNLTGWRHTSTPGAHNRVFTLVPGTNRVLRVLDTGVPRTYAYDPNGNLVQENVEREFGWTSPTG